MNRAGIWAALAAGLLLAHLAIGAVGTTANSADLVSPANPASAGSSSPWRTVAGWVWWVPSASAAVGEGCAARCRGVQRRCVLVARSDRRVALHACSTEPEATATCRRAATTAKREAARRCKDERRARCSPCCKQGGVAGINTCAMVNGVSLPAEPQDAGDPTVGRETLLQGDFMSCGIPFALWEIAPFRGTIAAGFGGTATDPPIPGRTGNSSDLPYFLNAFTTPDGVDVVNANCLLCHGSLFDGELVIGLANPTRDFTAGAGGGGTTIPLDDPVLDALGLTVPEKDELRQLFARGAIVGPQTRMRTVGMNPAEMLAVILMVHHDRDTLAWSDTPLTDVQIKDENGDPIEDAILTSDPAPWWRVHKKNGLFYNGMARGDHRGTMALATSVCVDSVDRALEVDAMFRDIQAYISSLRAPTYTRSIDVGLAATGAEVFARDCAMCHGTYAASDEQETYPNLLIPLDVVGTDPVVANAGVVHTPELVDWYNGSFYGQITRMEPDDPFPGYMPPPLDGIWATAPYFHNGSVPTIELVLDSARRPTYWRRVDFDSTHFDEDALGWPWEAVDTPWAEAPPAEAKLIYDTTLWSQSNKGHRFGDHLTDAERHALLEYLKTL